MYNRHERAAAAAAAAAVLLDPHGTCLRHTNIEAKRTPTAAPSPPPQPPPLPLPPFLTTQTAASLPHSRQEQCGA